MPVTMASLNVVEQATSSFVQEFLDMRSYIHQFTSNLKMLKTLYEVEAIRNFIPNGIIPYPEDAQSLRSGIAVEFR